MVVCVLVLFCHLSPIKSSTAKYKMHKYNNSMHTRTHACMHAHARTRACAYFTALWTSSGITWVSRYQNQSGFYWSKRQCVAVVSAGPYANIIAMQYQLTSCIRITVLGERRLLEEQTHHLWSFWQFPFPVKQHFQVVSCVHTELSN